MKKFHIYSEISILGLIFEILLISAVFLGIGYLSNQSDPLLISSPVNILLILISVVTLFYGLFSGIAISAITGFLLYSFYNPFPSNYFINNLLFMLIFSEFHFFWNRTLEKLKKQNDYAEIKLNELSKIFYALKISHDQIEKSYILKPNSLRNILQQIKNLYLNDEPHAYHELLTVISKSYSISRASLFLGDGEKFQEVASIGDTEPLNEDSKVFMDALETKTPSFLSNFEDSHKDYLAVIPAYDSEDRLKAVLTINDIKFMQFNKDVIFSISVLLGYFMDYASHAAYASDIIKKHPHCPVEFLMELKRLSSITHKLRVSSLMLVFKFKNPTVPVDDISLSVSKTLRALDLSCGKGNSIFILLPFVSASNAMGLVEKIKYETCSKFVSSEKDISYKMVEVSSNLERTLETINAMVQLKK